ncbi:hypothetical protein PIROE2DRAFT_13011 [Piromyces sp. E2]|nr:hypothetical protein PIROE2DRAFT_13011 [Piromyces sp. E2]|eukprot:OUM61096.1 hypothetical protein PIROE2DRAFT_13011 [Piromyces sp. E2]
MGIRGKCFDFLSNLYLTSKVRARFLDILSEEFPIKRGVRQGCPLSPILFNLFINDVLNGSNKHRTARIQTLINTGLFWCIGSYTHKKSSGNSYNKSESLRHNPTMKNLTALLKILLNISLHYLITHGPKESNILRNKLRKANCKDVKDIKSHYWKNILKFQGIKGQSYENNKFLYNKQIIMFQYQLPMIALECVPAVARVNNLLITGFFLVLPFLPIDVIL